VKRLAARAAKQGLGGLAVAPVLSRRTRHALDGTVNIVFAHYVGPPVPYYRSFYTGLDAEAFERRLQELGHWFRFAPLAEVVGGDGSSGGGKPALAVTFDDGFDMSSGPVPAILARHGIRATVFVITSCIGNRNLMWRNKLSAILAETPTPVVVAAYRDVTARSITRPQDVLQDSRGWPPGSKDQLADRLWERCGMPPQEEYLRRHRPYFDWAGLRAWTANGHDVGLHTHTHPFCERLTAADLEREIEAPARLLEAELGVQRPALSYPFGSRLPRPLEEQLVRDGVIGCALGIRGFAARGTPPQRLERATIEALPRWSVFGRQLLSSVRRSGRRVR
jgi:peptidoglycan/xylan/chitin deacetylase (PgdA/CDA1 family)